MAVSPGGHWPSELGLIPAGEYGQPHSGAMSSASSVRVPRLTPHSDISRQGCGHQSSVGGTQHEGHPELPPQSKDGKKSEVEGGMEGQRENFSRNTKELGREDSSVGESARYTNMRLWIWVSSTHQKVGPGRVFLLTSALVGGDRQILRFHRLPR